MHAWGWGCLHTWSYASGLWGGIRSSDRGSRESEDTPKGEQDIADAIDTWLESARALENMKAEYKLQDVPKNTALDLHRPISIPTGSILFNTCPVLVPIRLQIDPTRRHNNPYIPIVVALQAVMSRFKIWEIVKIPYL